MNKSMLKNKTSLPGIGLFIEESFVDSTDRSRNIFISKLKRELSNEYNLEIFEKVDFKKYKDGDKLESKIFKDFNIRFAILITEETGKERGEQVYQIESQNIDFYIEDILSDYDLDFYKKNLQIEINNIFREKYKINLNNNLIEIDRLVKEFHFALNYLTGLSYLFSKTPEKGLQYFYGIKEMQDRVEKKSGPIKYIIKFLNQRIFESKYFRMSIDFKYNNNYTYLFNNSLLETINTLISNSNEIKFQNDETYNAYYKNLLLHKSIVLFDLEEYDESLNIINSEKLDEYYPGESFFIRVACMFGSNSIDNRDALKFFKKNKFRFKISKSFFIDFVTKRYKYKSDNPLIKYLYMLMNRYYLDRSIASELIEEIIEENGPYSELLRK